MKILPTVIIIVFNLLFCSVHHISKDGSDLNSGTDWNNSFATIKKGLDSSVPGDEIWVSKGHYLATSAYDLIDSPRYYHLRLKNGVKLIGGFSGYELYGEFNIENRDLILNETIISGNIGSPDDSLDNCYHIFFHPDSLALDSTAVIDGFTITGGNADGTEYVHKFGGGIYNYECSPSLSNLLIKGNYALNDGGGIFNDCCEKTLYIDSCTISSNMSDNQGGGIYSYFTKSIINGSSFIDNSSGMFFSGDCLTAVKNTIISTNSSYGIVNIDGSVLDVDYSEISENGSTGLYNITYSEAFLNSCRIENNQATLGGGIYNLFNSSIELINCTVSNNTALNNGGGIYTDEGTVNIINSDIVSNTILGQSSKGGGLYGINSLITVSNSIFWNNLAPGWVIPVTGEGRQIYYTPGSGSYDRIFVKNSCCPSDVYNLSAIIDGTNNILSDPEFYNIESFDFRLMGYSPCLDMGRNDFINEDFDIRGEGFGRKLNSTDGTAGTVDIGAYEFNYGNDTGLFSPSNVIISSNGNSVYLTWNTVEGATEYIVYRSADPYGIFEDIGSTSDPFYTDTWNLTGSKYFYYLKAR